MSKYNVNEYTVDGFVNNHNAIAPQYFNAYEDAKASFDSLVHSCVEVNLSQGWKLIDSFNRPFNEG